MNLRIFDNAADLIQAAARTKAMSPRASARGLVARVAHRPSLQAPRYARRDNKQ